MTKLALVFASAVTLLLIAGCKKKAGSGGGQDSAAARAKMTELKDRLCACKDADCAMKVSDEVTDWSAAQAKAGAGTKMSPADKKQLDETAMQIADCMQKFITHGSGSALLDETACGIFTLHARYWPARDRAGKPISEVQNQTVRWQIPKD